MHPLLEFFIVLFRTMWLLLSAIVRRIASSLGLLPHKDVSGEVVLVTGAASGIGRLMAIEFAKRKATVVLWDLNKDGARAVAQEIEGATGREAFAYRCDVTKREEVYEIADAVRTDVGDVTILVNNAGIVTGKKFMDCPDALIQKTFEVNAISHFWTLKAFLPSMLQNNHGHVVTIASGAGLFGVAGLMDYCASKFAAMGTNEALQAELYVSGKTGIKTTVVCPYFISTGMFEGVKSKIPALLSISTPEAAVRKIIHAVLTEEPMLLIPSGAMGLTLALKGMLPVVCMGPLGDFTGVNHAMDNFVQTRPKQA